MAYQVYNKRKSPFTSISLHTKLIKKYMKKVVKELGMTEFYKNTDLCWPPESIYFDIIRP